MARSTGVILAVGGITIFNDVVLQNRPFNWKVPIATGIAALAFTGAEHVMPDVAVALAWLALVAVVFTRVDPSTPAPAEALIETIGGRKAGP